jgi:ribonuclease HI
MLEVVIYTDGSCHAQKKSGAWVAIVLINSLKIVLSGKEESTTHNRMELTAVLKAMEYIKNHFTQNRIVKIYSDSQYVVDLPARKEKLIKAAFVTKKGKELNNTDLIKLLHGYLNDYSTEFIKVKAHQKKDNVINYNIEADILSRKLIRES